MTQRNKLIVGGVIVLVAYYLYDRNKKMKAVADLKAGAETQLPAEIQAPVLTGGVKPTKMELMADSQKELNFAGSRGNSMTAQYYR